MNLQRLDAALAAIEAHPETWDQGAWASRECGTAYCVAGHVAVQAGAEIHWQAGWFVVDGRALETNWCRRPDGRLVEIDGYAQDLLGLTIDEADELFDQDNTLNDLWRLRDKLAAAHQVTP